MVVVTAASVMRKTLAPGSDIPSGGTGTSTVAARRAGIASACRHRVRAQAGHSHDMPCIPAGHFGGSMCAVCETSSAICRLLVFSAPIRSR